MKRTSSQQSIEGRRDSNHFVGLASENEKLHKQNESLMKELSLIKNDFERMSQNGQKTVKNGRRKSCEITGEMVNLQQIKSLEEELQNTQLRFNTLKKEFSIKTTQYQNQLTKQSNLIAQLQNENEMLKIKVENKENQNLEFKYQENFLEKSGIKIINENQKIKQLSESNIKLTKLLEDRLVQLEQLTKTLNLKNQEHMKEIEKYESLLKERTHHSSLSQGKSLESLQKRIDILEKDKIRLTGELTKTRDLNSKEKQMLLKEKQNINLEKEKLHSDMSIIQQQLTDYYNQLQQCGQQLKQKDESIKQFQQSESYQGYQNQQYENQQQKSLITQLQVQIGNLQQTNKALHEELLFLKTTAPLSNRTNLKTYFGVDSPFKNIADEQNKYNITLKTRTQSSLDQRGRSQEKYKRIE
ncbi:unnamed protein product (macronuclear) [Paramecium tetraurelia]|uniref:Uncharacterized protein n=1 Tax=Paramecium tetraurelia TaxID=5888 RepID=A0DFR5_PARTE|nr:uncharacterized protein GSPATT00016695001 [Paramecium tetraurelia]CAK81882.1 unnamed protein product [Paramecium tetraurelia]|eukprot:XP_001449279.1 hypothetical protein (macronuclear) [Paramecium tetraurelia strain d4-2]